MRLSVLLLLILLPITLIGADRPSVWTEADFEPISSGLANPARIALRQNAGGVTVVLEVAPYPGSTNVPTVVLGVAAASKQILNAK